MIAALVSRSAAFKELEIVFDTSLRTIQGEGQLVKTLTRVSVATLAFASGLRIYLSLFHKTPEA